MRRLAIVLVSLLSIGAAEAASVGSWLGIASVGTGRKASIEFRSSSGFDSDGASLVSHDYFRLSNVQAVQLADGIEAFRENPHSLSIFSAPGGEYGFVLVGTSRSGQPSAVLQIQMWTYDPQSPGHHHGGPSIDLSYDDLGTIAEAIRSWQKGTVADQTLIYQKAN